MTHYFERLKKQLSKKSPSQTSDHYLFLLGTGVNYVDQPINTEKNHFYIRGETFSYAAQLTSHLLGETDEVIKREDASDPNSPQYAHPYHSPSVDVINGPDAPGREIGDRLAKALLLALGAVAEGKNRLHLSGFSRGGVEAIVLTHELARVMDMLRDDLAKAPQERGSLASIIADSSSVPGLSVTRPPSYTRSALEILLDVKHSKLFGKDKDAEDLLKKKLLSNLDKMKVDLFVLDPVPGGNFIKIFRLGWQEPQYFYHLPDFVENKQEFVQKHETSNCFKPIIPEGMPYEVVPGCHGTADGNQYDDNSDPIDAEGEVKSAQNMVLCRWIDFTFPGLEVRETINLKHSELDKIVSNYIGAVPKERNKQLLANYEEMKKNYPAFEFLATKNYTGLGRYMEERQVHFHVRGDTPISDLDVHGGKKFLNLQHVKLWMSNELDVFSFFDKSLVEQVQWLTDNIQNAFSPLDSDESKDNNLLQESHSNLGASSHNPKLMIADLLLNKANHPLVQESLSFLVNTLMQTYLRNHLSETDRSAFKTGVENAFKILNVAKSPESNSAEMSELATNLSDTISNDMTRTLLQHQNALLSLAEKQLQEQLQEPLQEQSEDSNHPVHLNWLINMQKLGEDLNLLGQQLNDLEKCCDKDILNQAWGNALPHFTTGLEETIDYETQKARLLKYLRQQQTLLQDRAIRVLRNMPEALDVKPEELEEGFYEHIHRYAMIDRLEASVLQLQEQLKTDRQSYEGNLKTLQSETQRLTSELDQIYDNCRSLSKDNVQQQEDIDALTKALETAKEREVLLYSREQRDAGLKVQGLLDRVYLYQNHLNQSRDTSDVLKRKKELIAGLIDTLENPKRADRDGYYLPTEQLEQFHTTLSSVQDDLKAHRDPTWQRFIRDSLRIVTRVFSGIGFYRMAKGHSSHFFKPSHGERFLEDLAQSDPSPVRDPAERLETP